MSPHLWRSKAIRGSVFERLSGSITRRYGRSHPHALQRHPVINLVLTQTSARSFAMPILPDLPKVAAISFRAGWFSQWLLPDASLSAVSKPKSLAARTYSRMCAEDAIRQFNWPLAQNFLGVLQTYNKEGNARFDQRVPLPAPQKIHAPQSSQVNLFRSPQG